MTNKIKLLFIDLDGTAIDSRFKGKKSISSENVAIVNLARKHDIEVVVSTGRRPSSSTNYFLNLLNSNENYIA
ncbi:UNVERIFIED_CONTAM: HAD hydrolase family protein [Campylobacter lari]